MMTNIPELKLGLVSVSRDCFPMALSVGRRDALAAAYAKYGMLHNCPVCIESETDVAPALADLKGCRGQRLGDLPGQLRSGDGRDHSG